MIIDMFKEMNFVAINALLTSNTEQWQNDDNLGLVKQCIRVMVKRKIQSVTITHVSMSMEGIAQRAGVASVEEAERILLSMVHICIILYIYGVKVV